MLIEYCSSVLAPKRQLGVYPMIRTQIVSSKCIWNSLKCTQLFLSYIFSRRFGEIVINSELFVWNELNVVFSVYSWIHSESVLSLVMRFRSAFDVCLWSLRFAAANPLHEMWAHFELNGISYREIKLSNGLRVKPIVWSVMARGLQTMLLYRIPFAKDRKKQN